MSAGLPNTKQVIIGGFINSGGQKMSKSLGNFYTLRDLLDKGYDSRAIRYLLLSSHYRQQSNFTEEGIKAAENAIQRLNDFVAKLKTIKDKSSNNQTKKIIEHTKKNFEKEMDDDLEISNALAAVFVQSSTLRQVFSTR